MLTIEIKQVHISGIDELLIAEHEGLTKAFIAKCPSCGSDELVVKLDMLDVHGMHSICQACLLFAALGAEDADEPCYLAPYIGRTVAHDGSESVVLNVFNDPLKNTPFAVAESADPCVASPYGEHWLMLTPVPEEAAGRGEVEENYVGLVNEWCQQRRLKSPEYTFETRGPSHQPTITARANVVFKGRTYSAIVQASSKKIAKHGAAKELYSKIRPNG